MVTRLLLTADRRRSDSGVHTTAYDLWRLVREQLGGDGPPDARVRLLRHAMIHAGMLKSKDADGVETPYLVCPVCDAKLT